MANDETRSADAAGDAQDRRVMALLDTILPANDDGTMPSAAELDFTAYLNEQAPDFLPRLAAIADGFDDDFPDRPLTRRVALLEAYARTDAQAFSDLLFRVYDCYYQDDRVRERIGMRPGPPFPQGNVVVPGDLSTLDAVVKRARGYRR